MKLKKLIENLPVQTYRNKDIEITGLCAHSSLTAPGNLFISKKGNTDDGTKYIEEAISSGAIAILCEEYNPFLKNVVQIIHPKVREMEGIMASRFYGDPSRNLFMVAVTGTSGKTTVAYLLKHLLDKMSISCGLIGTIEYIVGSYHFESDLTTPDVLTNHKLLREMVRNNCRAAVMEVSSHGIAQGRIEKINFDTAVFTNLSQDHLDYHQTMQSYADEKAKLFASLAVGKHAIFNLESSWTSSMLKNCMAEKFFYGFTDKAHLYAEDVVFGPNYTEFVVSFDGMKEKIRWELIGRFNILNCLAAIAVCLTKGHNFKEILSHIPNFVPTRGRLEKVENLANLNIYIDYAHKPDALEKVLLCLQELKKGKIITVFGCGGNRDKAKRPLMGSIAAKLSDVTIVTSDNPRNEEPDKIINEILAGMQHSSPIVELDRRKAIEKAIHMAHKDDLILIAGKGHETYQISHQIIPFDDRRVAQEIANKL